MDWIASNCGNETQIFELNEDCRFAFERLNATTLLAVAQINEYFRGLAANFFKRKYDDKVVEIRSQYDDQKRDIAEYRENLIIERLDVIEKLFKSFGEVISRATLNTGNTFQDKFIERVVKIVSHNSEGLNIFKLYCIDRLLLEYVDEPFRNVEHLILTNRFQNLRSKTLKLNDIFPNLRKLHLKEAHIKNALSLIVPFKHLEQLDVQFGLNYDIPAVGDLIEKNPQLRKLGMNACSIEFLEFLSVNAPNLDYLTFGLTKPTPSELNTVIHFKSVKHLSLGTDYNAFPKNVTFDQLEELQLTGTGSATNLWMNFIKKHVKLNKVEVEWFVLNSQLESLIGNVPNVIEAHFGINTDVQNETIVAFLEGNDQLKRLELNYRESAKEASKKFDDLKKIIDNTKWKLTLDFRTCIIERKNYY